ncbi:hypothetical protein [Comamonas sp. JC664]
MTREYDLAGNLVKTTDGLGRATVHVYNNTQKRTTHLGQWRGDAVCL